MITYSTKSVVLVVVLWLLDHVSPDDVVIAVAIVLDAKVRTLCCLVVKGDRIAHLFVCDEVCLLEQFLLVMLEFSDHVCASLGCLFVTRCDVEDSK